MSFSPKPKHIAASVRALVLVAAALFPLVLATPTLAAVETVYIVNSTTDTNDGNCDTTHCSLREAINAANSHAGNDKIRFAIPGAGIHTITPVVLPSITDNVVIDGYSQTGASVNTSATGNTAQLRIHINCSATPNNCLEIDAGTSTVKGLLMTNYVRAIYIAGGSSNKVYGNWIGLDSGGNIGAGGDTAIVVRANPTFIGSTAPANRNMIADSEVGIELAGDEGKDAQVIGNSIGTNIDGNTAIPNLLGVYIHDTTGSQVRNNLISGNTYGIYAIHINSQVLIQDNLIGTNSKGSGALPNLYFGIYSESIGHHFTIVRNVISGNTGYGIYTDSSAVAWSSNVIAGNWIGTDSTGKKDIGNGSTGILIEWGNDNRVGPSQDFGGNVIANNGADGLNLTAGERNLISHNSFFNNASVGIDLGTSNVTANDVGDGDTGPNLRQNYPVITKAKASTGKIAASLDSTINRTYTIEYFASPSCDPTNYGEGKTYLGKKTVAIGATSPVTFKVKLAGTFQKNQFITATARDPNNNTSEFSMCVKAK